MLEALAEVEGKAVSVMARDIVSKALEKGPTSGEETEVLSEVLALGSLVGELVIEFMVHVYDGDQEKAFTKSKEMFQRARADKTNGGA